MLEFRDDVSQRWMVNFLKYKDEGFPNNNWKEYIEKMIKTDTQIVEALRKPVVVGADEQQSLYNETTFVKYDSLLGKLYAGNRVYSDNNCHYT
jgi:hypothetical protein